MASSSVIPKGSPKDGMQYTEGDRMICEMRSRGARPRRTIRGACGEAATRWRTASDSRPSPHTSSVASGTASATRSNASISVKMPFQNSSTARNTIVGFSGNAVRSG